MRWLDLQKLIERELHEGKAQDIASIDLDLSEGDNELAFTYETLADGRLIVHIDNLGNPS